MGDLKGRDVNGMHAAQWGKLDISAISKVKVPDKCTNDQLADAFKSMLVEAVNKLYGDSKDKKYVKIVDMMMMRVRGALNELNKQIQEAQEKNAKSLDADELVSKLSKALAKIVEQNESASDENASSKLQELYEAVNKLISDESEKNAKEETQSKNDGESKLELERQQENGPSESINDFNKIDTSIKEQHDASQNQIQLLEDLQKQITDNFSKIESLITANDVQKNAEVVAAQMSKPVEDKVVSIEKNNEKQIRQQISSLNSKTGNINEKDSSEGKDKKKQRSKKTDLKDVMTGKQFNMLKNMLKTQFFEVTDLSTESIKKSNKQFKNINDNVEKLVKDRQKNGFSWAKLIMFLSLFFIPFFWSNIKNFINTAGKHINLDEQIDKAAKFVDTKVTEYINNIDWDKIATQLKDQVWDYLVKKFNEFIKDPMGWMAEEIQKTYNDCVAWVKDLWKVVTGQSKEDNLQEKKKLEDQHVKRIDKNIDNFKKDLTEHTNEINGTAEIKTNELKREVEKSNNFIVTSEKQTVENLSKMQNVVEVKTQNLDKTALSAIDSTSKFALASQQNLESGVNSALSAGMQTLTNDTKSIIDEMKKNGPPSDFDKAMMKSFETASANVEKEEPDRLTQPDISKLTSVKDYVMVKSNDKKNGIIARKSEVNDQLNLLQKNTKSKNIQHIQNYIDFGEYNTTENIFNSKTEDDDDKRREYLNYLYNKKNSKLEEKVSNESTDETLVEREARLYSNVSNGYDAVIKNSATIQNGLEKNQKLLDKIYGECNSMFTDISITLKTMKNAPQSTINNTSVISVSSSNSNEKNLIDANIKD